jgi:hypothetical protein
VHGRDRPNELLNEDRFAHAGPAEDAGLTALGERSDQVDDLEPRLENLHPARLLFEGRRRPVNRITGCGLDFAPTVDRDAEDVEHTAERGFADRDGDRAPGGASGHPSLQAVGGVHRHRAHLAIAQVALHFEHQRRLVRPVQLDGIVDLRQFPQREFAVDDPAQDLHDFPCCVRHQLDLPVRILSQAQVGLWIPHPLPPSPARLPRTRRFIV